MENEAGVPKAAVPIGPELGFWAATRRRLALDDPFFAAGELERELLAKHIQYVLKKIRLARKTEDAASLLIKSDDLGLPEKLDDIYL